MSGPRMSITPGYACEDVRMQRSHYRVLGYVGRHTNRAGWAYIYQEEAARTLSISRETVNRALGDLKKWGYITRQHIIRNGKKIAYVRVFLDAGEPEFVPSDEQKFDDDHGNGGGGMRHKRGDKPDLPVSPASHVTPTSQVTCDAQPGLPVTHRSHVTPTSHKIGAVRHTERLTKRLKEEEEDRLQLRSDNEADCKRGTSAPSSFQIFEEFAEAADRHGFLTPPENQFQKYSTALRETVEQIGIDRWREFLTLAGADDLCTGRVAPGPGWQKPWRLSIRQASDAGWISDRMAAWQGHQQAEAKAEKTVIKPDSDDWFAVKNFYEATGQASRARVMVASRCWVVQPDVLKKARAAARELVTTAEQGESNATH